MFHNLLPLNRVTCQYDTTRALEVNSNGGFKREHAKSCSSTTKNISLLPQCYGHQSGMVVTNHEGLPPIMWHDPLITWSCKIKWQSKSIYLHYHGVYGHQTWQDGDLPWEAAAHWVIWPFVDMILWDHVTKENHYHRAYGHQIWQSGDLPGGAPSHGS